MILTFFFFTIFIFIFLNRFFIISYQNIVFEFGFNQGSYFYVLYVSVDGNFYIPRDVFFGGTSLGEKKTD